MDQIFWEKTVDGKSAHAANISHIKVNSFAMRQIALAKMTDVTLISAEFNDTSTVFQPWISILIDKGSCADFMGVYKLGLPLEEGESGPSICLRRSSWNRDKDIEQFNLADDKRAYVQNDNQVESRIVFADHILYKEIDQLATELIIALRDGLKFELTEHPEAGWHEIKCEVIDDLISHNVSYTPFACKSAVLEEWIGKWSNSFAKINFLEDGYIPNSGCKVSYRVSLEEQMSRLSI